MRIEEKIRDYLADNLEFISKDLKLIRKEYYLPAQIGAKGYIDILAKDNLNNFVVIEVKRSEQAARQTINELLKYQGLLKQIYKAQDSEIKLLIVSTSWNELIIPFSEIYDSVYLTGYSIELNDEDIPISIKKIKPVELTTLERKISPTQSLELFYDSGKRDEFLKTIQEKLHTFGINDFVFVKMKSNGLNDKIVFPYALYFAFQRQTMKRNYELIPDLNDEIEDIEFDDVDHKLKYIDEHIYTLLECHEYNDSMEEADPVKFSYIINCGHWDIEGIVKNGIFSNDPRITDELIINEIKGYDGENETRYLEFVDSENPKKLDKVQKNIKKSLQWNKKLYQHIKQIIETAIDSNSKFKLVIDIFYPRSIFDAIWRFYSTYNPNFMPLYNIIVMFENSEPIKHYHGELAWTGKDVDVKKVFETITEDEPFFTFMQCSIGSFDNELLKLMKLKFVNVVYNISEGKTENTQQIKRSNKKFVKDLKEYKDMSMYFQTNDELMTGITILYKQFTNA